MVVPSLWFPPCDHCGEGVGKCKETYACLVDLGHSDACLECKAKSRACRQTLAGQTAWMVRVLGELLDKAADNGAGHNVQLDAVVSLFEMIQEAYPPSKSRMWRELAVLSSLAERSMRRHEAVDGARAAGEEFLGNIRNVVRRWIGEQTVNGDPNASSPENGDEDEETPGDAGLASTSCSMIRLYA